MPAIAHPSIVVFTRGRPASVRRLARYYDGYPGQLVVVDGSPEPADGLRMPARGEYLHRPGASVYGRMRDGIARVDAPSCALAADDDYQSPAGLAACARAIEDDPGVACAAGTVVYFSEQARGARATVADGAVERILAIRRSADPAERFHSAISMGPQVFYACLRTDVANRVASALASIDDRDGLAGEQLWTSLPSLFGRIEFVDRLQICRRRFDKDYSSYLAPFRALDDIGRWDAFPRIAAEVRGLAADAGLDAGGAERVIGSWRLFASHTARGMRSWKHRRLPARVRARRTLHNVLESAMVGLDPRAWTDVAARDLARGRAARLTLAARAYPWSDASARSEFERIMAFDARPEAAS